MITKFRIYIVIGIISSFFPSMLQAQITLKDWVVEDHSGKMQMQVSNDTLDIIAPKGLTLWYDHRLTGDYEISYHAKLVMKGGKYDRLSDLNCFWGANDPKYPDNLYARSTWRNGFFPNYNSLNLFYVGYGGNYNKTTRFRQYLGGTYEMNNPKVRPVLKEYTDSLHLLVPNKWYHIQIRIEKGITTYRINGEELFRLHLKEKEGDGHFGLRLLNNHTVFANFRVKTL